MNLEENVRAVGVSAEAIWGGTASQLRLPGNAGVWSAASREREVTIANCVSSEGGWEALLMKSKGRPAALGPNREASGPHHPTRLK